MPTVQELYELWAGDSALLDQLTRRTTGALCRTVCIRERHA
jgi:hypothetical protein